MSAGDNHDEQDPNIKEQNRLKKEIEDQPVWDNDTYGHSPDASAFKKKNELDEKHIEDLEKISNDSNINSSDELKNINLSENDLSKGPKDNEKGIGGKSL